jgi:hypothetical protein
MAIDPFHDLQIPLELQASLERHHQHRAQLVTSLRSAGVDEAQIEKSVAVIIASYKAQLIQAMKRLANVD